MPIFGLVVQLRPESTAATVSAALQNVPGVAKLGEITGRRIPLVLDFDGPDDLALDSIYEVPGVLGVDLAFVDFSDLGEAQASQRC